VPDALLVNVEDQATRPAVFMAMQTKPTQLIDTAKLLIRRLTEEFAEASLGRFRLLLR
jgi:hypothetical protein